LGLAGFSIFQGGRFAGRLGPCGSVVEHSLGKGEVAGPIPAMGTSDSWICSGVSAILILELKNGKREI
jgi:streptogramin lyase